MKVILLRDVAKIGRRAQVVELPDGYALNQLIPKRWAEPASPANLKRLAQSKAGAQAQDDSKQEAFARALAELNTSPLQVVADANAQEHLFKAVHEADVVTAAKLRGIVLETRAITIESPIKALGPHTITLREGVTSVAYTIEVIKKT
jgi:large subunit ribosomal protein L9